MQRDKSLRYPHCEFLFFLIFFVQPVLMIFESITICEKHDISPLPTSWEEKQGEITFKKSDNGSLVLDPQSPPQHEPFPQHE